MKSLTDVILYSSFTGVFVSGGFFMLAYIRNERAYPGGEMYENWSGNPN
jgi:hypothetical protein